ncbi:MAG: carboxymuconolactone decarboxylase family protein [Bryobacteraceae bacterium]|nr:carboxymuconolactone decarboxylase family protein [Bryobacteraceae bacterium]
MEARLPKSIEEFQKRYPKIWEAFDKLGEACHENGGPLDERTRRLVKLGIAVGSQHEGAVHSAVRNAVAAGLAAEEIRQVAILAITTIGWPAAYAALKWTDETIADSV